MANKTKVSHLSGIADAIHESVRKNHRTIKVTLIDHDGEVEHEFELNRSKYEAQVIMYGIKKYLDVCIPIWSRFITFEENKS